MASYMTERLKRRDLLWAVVQRLQPTGRGCVATEPLCAGGHDADAAHQRAGTLESTRQ